MAHMAGGTGPAPAGQVAPGHGSRGKDPERGAAIRRSETGTQEGDAEGAEGAQGDAEGAGDQAAALASLDDRLVDFHGRYLAASRAFLRAPSMGAMELLLAAYTLWHNARYGSEAGLDYELEKISTQCRNILAGLP